MSITEERADALAWVEEQLTLLTRLRATPEEAALRHLKAVLTRHTLEVRPGWLSEGLCCCGEWLHACPDLADALAHVKAIRP